MKYSIEIKFLKYDNLLYHFFFLGEDYLRCVFKPDSANLHH